MNGLGSIGYTIAGECCKEAGLPVSSCPFQKGTAQYDLWVSGWKRAKKLKKAKKVLA